MLNCEPYTGPSLGNSPPPIGTVRQYWVTSAQTTLSETAKARPFKKIERICDLIGSKTGHCWQIWRKPLPADTADIAQTIAAIHRWRRHVRYGANDHGQSERISEAKEESK